MKLSALLILLSVSSFSFEISIPNEKILSRKRRYLVFPEGSSLQLVYCLTMPSLGMGRIFTIGSTAAMAWILPNEPMVFLDKKNKKQEHAMESEPVHDESSDFMLNHDFEDDPYSNWPHDHYPQYNMKDGQKKYYNFKGYDRVGRPQINYVPRHSYHHSVEPEHWKIYRRTRRSLYRKLERLLNALSKDGRACILKLICEVSQIADKKGTFMEEVVKVIFRIKTHDTMADEDIYDGAANKKHHCKEKYKNCPETFFVK